MGTDVAIETADVALMGFGLGLAAVVLAHEVAEVVVIANGVRAGHAKPWSPCPATSKPHRPAPQWGFLVTTPDPTGQLRHARLVLVTVTLALAALDLGLKTWPNAASPTTLWTSG